METNVRKLKRESGWTIVELLTVMSIIIILVGLLVPGMNLVRKYAMKVKQRAQFYSIGTAMELFSIEHKHSYPDSRPLGGDGEPYCGAMKLAEAMVGWDARGFHPRSTFVADGDDLIFQGLAQHFKYGMPELRQFVKEQDPAVAEAYLPRPRPVPPTDQSGVGDGIVR